MCWGLLICSNRVQYQRYCSPWQVVTLLADCCRGSSGLLHLFISCQVRPNYWIYSLWSYFIWGVQISIVAVKTPLGYRFIISRFAELDKKGSWLGIMHNRKAWDANEPVHGIFDWTLKMVEYRLIVIWCFCKESNFKQITFLKSIPLKWVKNTNKLTSKAYSRLGMTC